MLGESILGGFGVGSGVEGGSNAVLSDKGGNRVNKGGKSNRDVVVVDEVSIITEGEGIITENSKANAVLSDKGGDRLNKGDISNRGVVVVDGIL